MKARGWAKSAGATCWDFSFWFFLVHEPISPSLDQQEGKQYFPPVFDRPVYATNLQSIIRIMDFEFLITTSAFEKVAGASFALAGFVIHTDSWMRESSGVVEAVLSFENLRVFLISLYQYCFLYLFY